MEKQQIADRFNDVLSALKRTKKIGSKSSFAEKLGKSPSFISEITAGRNMPSNEVLDYLVTNFGVNKKYILEGTGSPFGNEDIALSRDEAAQIVAERVIELQAGQQVVISLLAKIYSKTMNIDPLEGEELVKRVHALELSKLKDELSRH